MTLGMYVSVGAFVYGIKHMAWLWKTIMKGQRKIIDNISKPYCRKDLEKHKT